jgi:DNA-binding transcriptional ArsR family regulator
MALEDFLGVTSEIRIIDFLADNMDCSYSQTDICEHTGLSRTTVYQKIPELIQKNIVVIDREVGKFKTFKLADNDIIKYLMAAALVESFKEAENPLSDEEQLEQIKIHLGEHQALEEGNGRSNGSIIQMPIDGSIILTRDTAEKMFEMLDKKLERKKSPG